jgi:hypothetical protein
MTNTETITLYRPTGPEELRLVEESGWQSWPPRLPEQPIFYPVTNERYAREITEQWNVPERGVGFVTKFEVRKSFMDRYEVKCVGAKYHTEWWIPDADLEELNRNIVGRIEIIGEYRQEQVGVNSTAPSDAELERRGAWFRSYAKQLDHSVMLERKPGVRYRCPCCGCRTLEERGGFEICPVCFWEDDGQDDHDADVVRGGPNGPLSLTQARRNYGEFGACSREEASAVRPPTPDELE